MRAEVERFAADVVDSYEKIQNLVDSITSWWSRVRSDILVEYPDFVDISAEKYFVAPPSFCSQIYSVGSCSFQSPFDYFGALPGASYLYSMELHDVYASYVQNITLASLETFNRAIQLRALLQDVPGISAISPNDYAPPEYRDFADSENVTMEEKRHKAEADAFIERQSVTLNLFAELQQNSNDEDDSEFTFNLSTSSFATSTNLDVLSWISLEESRIDWGEIFIVGIGRLSMLFLFFDYAWRFIQSYRAFQRFWGRSGVRLPVPDLRFDAKKQKSRERGRWLHRCVEYGWLISAVSSTVAIITIFVVALCLLCSATYVPVRKFIDSLRKP